MKILYFIYLTIFECLFLVDTVSCFDYNNYYMKIRVILKYLTKTHRYGFFFAVFFLINLSISPSFFSVSKAGTDKVQIFHPAPLLNLDSFFTHHVLIAEKSTHTLYLFKNRDGLPDLIKTYQMATGKVMGDKESEGDFKTPEGIYNLTDFLTNKQLLAQSGPQAAIYGAGAFVMDFPNPIDHLLNKSGSGIWLHSTNDETRIEKGLDSRGCVVTANKELIEISKYLELNKTPIVIVQDLHYLSEKNYIQQQQDLRKFVESWLLAWQEKNIDAYINHYHPQDFTDEKGRFNQYKAYKKAVFSMPGNPKIQLNHISILRSKNYALVTFSQNYQSKTINDIGKKMLYLRQDHNYQWKIVSENWTKNGVENIDKIAFEPSFRFFKEGTFEGIEIRKGNN